MPTVPQNPNDIRGPIESTFNKNRDELEQAYIQDRQSLETDYHQNVRNTDANKREALVAAGLNPDGSTPSDYTPS